MGYVGSRLQAEHTGNSPENVHAENPTGEHDAEWGNGDLNPKKFLELVYTGIAN